MYILLSGEGPGDIGRCSLEVSQCENGDFIPGPMAIMVDHLIEQAQGYECSCLENGLVEYVSERYLADGASDLKALRKSPSSSPSCQGKDG